MFINFVKGVAAGSNIRIRKSNGLSVVEQLVTLALVGALACMAASAYQNAIEKRKLSNAADQVSSFLNSVMAEAVQRNRHANVSYQTDEDGRWCIGATLQGSPCDCMETNANAPLFCGLDSINWALRETDMSNGDLLISAAGVGNFTLNPVRRHFIDVRNTPVFGLQSENLAYRVQIQLSASGRALICRAEDSKKIHSYQPCSPTVM